MQIKVQSFNDCYQNIEADAIDAPKLLVVTPSHRAIVDEW